MNRLAVVALVCTLIAACDAETMGLVQQASEAWGCAEGNVSAVELDTLAECQSGSDPDRRCYKVAGCGKTTFVSCLSSSPSGVRHSRTQWSCGTIASDARATNGQTYAKWSQALLESAKKDIPCADVTPVNFREGNVAASPWMVDGCGVRVTYVEGAKDSSAATPMVLRSRTPSTASPTPTP
jgi:hypothetical protein